MNTTNAELSALVYDANVEIFREKLEKFLEDHSEKSWGNQGLKKPHTMIVTLEHGPKYTRVVRQERWNDTGEINHRSVYCFIQKETGDILKPAGWKAPAKHPRGNIYNRDPLTGCGPYGVAYLR